jgi:serine/threonine protein kinase
MIFNPGDVIIRGKYQIVDWLGKGGFGEVFQARDTLLKREVALKVIQRSAAGSTADEFLDYKERFTQEAVIGAQIHNENVIAVYAIEELGEDQTIVLITEFAGGGDLKKSIDYGPFTPEKTIDLGIQVCKGLEAINAAPVNGVHRDIKPTNILFDKDKVRAKVADLGLVQTSLSDRSGNLARKHPGTPGYMSPEQEITTGYLRSASDLYSLGCVLFETLIQKPYQSLPRGTKASSLRPDVPPGLQEVLDKALEVDVDMRYQDAAAMRQALERLVKTPSGHVETAPFLFLGGDTARTPLEWASLADKHWEESRNRLSQGELEGWLQGMNRTDLSAQVTAIRQKYPNDPDLALDQVLYLLQPKLERPALVVDATSLDFGQLERGQSRTVAVTISNPKRGILSGTIKPAVPWLSVDQLSVKCLGGKSQVVNVTLNSSTLEEGLTMLDNILAITTYNGSATLGGRVNVSWAPGLAFSPGKVNFGQHEAGAVFSLKLQELKMRNKGGGTLQGDITTPADWLAIVPSHFELAGGKEATIQLTADPSRLNTLGIFSTQVTVSSNAGNQVIPAKLTYTSAAYLPAMRLQKWGIYLGIMLFVLAGWAVPLAYGLRYLLSFPKVPSMLAIFNNPGAHVPTILGIAGLLLWTVLAWVTAVVMPRKLAGSLDEIENFYHRGNLADAIPGRRPAFLMRVLFGLIVGGAAALFANLAKTGTASILHQEGLSIPIPMFWLAALAGFLFGFLLINARKPGKEFSLGDRIWAGPRAILLAIVFMLMLFAFALRGINLWDMVWLLALGLVMAGDNFVRLPLRVQWIYARLRPVLPALILVGMFFFWARSPFARGAFLSGSTTNLAVFYGLRTNMLVSQYSAWKDLVYVLGVLLLGWAGLFFNNAPEDGLRPNFTPSVAALLIGGAPAYLGFVAVANLARLMKNSGSAKSPFGSLGMVIVVGLAGAALWLISRYRQELNTAITRLFSRISALLARLPAQARNVMARIPAVNRKSGFADYLTASAAIPTTASLLALLMIVFTLPADYAILRNLTIQNSTWRTLFLCLILPAGLVAGGYYLWKRRQGKK